MPHRLEAAIIPRSCHSEQDLGKSVRGQDAGKYLNARGLRVLEALDSVAAGHHASAAEVALARLIARKGVAAPIASATTLEQVDSLIRAARLSLSASDLERLNVSSKGGVCFKGSRFSCGIRHAAYEYMLPIRSCGA